MEDQIRKVLDEVRPMLALHGGDVELVKVEDGIVYVHMLGMCRDCPLSQLTLKAGIEEILLSKVAGIKSVQAA